MIYAILAFSQKRKTNNLYMISKYGMLSEGTSLYAHILFLYAYFLYCSENYKLTTQVVETQLQLLITVNSGCNNMLKTTNITSNI